MVYQGSKNRIAKYIIPIIQSYIERYNIKTYIEPFVGGANMIDKVECENRYGFDINKNVISLLKYCQAYPNIDIAPETCDFEHYKDVRNNQNTGKYSEEYVALIGYCASYGGRYFDGGYGKDRKGERNIYAERILNLKSQAPNLKDIIFDCKDYKGLDISSYENCLFYLDPPYKGTKQYKGQTIDYDYFYNFCRELGKKNVVFISEYYMPNDFECLWQKEVKVLQKSNRIIGEIATEKLFIKNGLEV